MRNIVLIRTSTVKQEVETQKKEVIEYASSYGAENIVVIGGAGASAIKLDDQYLFNLQQVYAELEKGDVQCIYAWSIDRIGRNEEVLMQLKNHLIKHKVQLRIKNPTLYLFDDDGKVNSGMDKYREERIEALNGRKNSLLGQVEELEKKDIELDERYFSGTTIRNYDGLKKTIQLKINSFKSEIDGIDLQISKLDNERVEPIDLYSLNDEERREVCMKHIDHIYATKMDHRNSMIDITALGTTVTVQYNRTTKCFTYTNFNEPHWQPIKIIRSIEGRKRSAV